jgi:hypothetical protein
METRAKPSADSIMLVEKDEGLTNPSDASDEYLDARHKI